LESGRDYVINQCPAFIFRKDKPFAMWMASQGIAVSPATSGAVALRHRLTTKAQLAALRDAGEALHRPGGIEVIRNIVAWRTYLTLMLTIGVGVILMRRFPFSDYNAMLLTIAAERPAIFAGIKYAYDAMLFSTPLIGASMLFSILYIFFVRPQQYLALSPLSPYPPAADRDRLFLVVGELHHPKRPEPVEQPQWLTIPDRGLYTGIAIFGAIGTGKTSCCMYPFTEQTLAYRATDISQRAAASFSKSRAASATRCGQSSNGMAASTIISSSSLCTPKSPPGESHRRLLLRPKKM
jgi:hypothetical protein